MPASTCSPSVNTTIRRYVVGSDAAILAFIAARPDSIRLSTAATLITTNDSVRIAEEFATLVHLSEGRST
jgi:alkanesulfonate monooxygenase SsuD/methylene tetrahydromethanopterin reductase-like flavin-dependent oxidoreductase (luciferase family)